MTQDTEKASPRHRSSCGSASFPVHLIARVVEVRTSSIAVKSQGRLKLPDELAWGWLGGGFGMALVWLWGRIEVPLGSQLAAYWLPTIWLWYGLRVALGGFGMASGSNTPPQNREY